MGGVSWPNTNKMGEPLGLFAELTLRELHILRRRTQKCFHPLRAITRPPNLPDADRSGGLFAERRVGTLGVRLRGKRLFSQMSVEIQKGVELEPVWCAVANVVIERQYGPHGSLRRSGTKHFPSGAKVYALSFFWGDAGERVTVLGRHRGSHRYVTMTMRTDFLANWRTEQVYNPRVADEIRAQGEYDRQNPSSEAARHHAEHIVAVWKNAGAKTQPFITRPPSTEAEPPGA